MKKCPFCGAELPDEASFCPHCAKSLNHRTETKLPRRLPKSVLRLIITLLLITFAAGTVYFYTRPRTYDSGSTGELSYTDQDGSYQLLVNVSNDRYMIMTETGQMAGDEENYRFPVRLYINDKGSGADASGRFLQKVRSAAVTVEQPADAVSPVKATEPTPNDSFETAALVSLIDFTRRSPADSQIVWKLEMKNGDQLILRLNFHMTPINTYEFSEKDADLSSASALQALIDRIAADQDIQRYDNVNIHLPAVRYTEPVILHSRSFQLIGSEENGARTDFSAGIQLRPYERYTWITYLTDLDFTGNGSGVGVSSAGRTWVKNCRFSGWKTAFLGFGNAWINAWDCTFEQNETGLYFNSENGSPSDTRFIRNRFSDNGTAVLLEKVPSDAKLNFEESEFSGNGTDIDNRCNQPLDLSLAVFH